MHTTLIVGPVRAGKSSRAAALARASGKPVTFVATAAIDPGDAEMRARVDEHRRTRPREWSLVETGAPNGPALTEVLARAPAGDCVVIDALGTWIAASLLRDEARAARDPVGALAALDAQGAELAAALATTRAESIVVAEETGWGVVPPTPLGRIFRDALGRLTRTIARDAARVELVVAGYAIDVRAIGTPVEEPPA
ncbi:MAG TPA: bifunctional adenosylcobinamide kinase/adenosylcobinamide-phosphate guanylyltransferase [Candidatus Elarobacter sp.]|jgi:adenosylcobinamide kinase/adenosylcobinamide-phosphate guanylyltransferase